MANVSDANTEDNRSSESKTHNQPDSPCESSSLTTDSEKCHSDTRFDQSTSGRVEEFGDEEYLSLVLDWSAMIVPV